MGRIDPAIGHGTPPADVDLVGRLVPIGQAAMADQPTALFATDQQLQQASLGHQTLKGPQTDAVMTGGEIEQGGLFRQLRPTAEPSVQQISTAADRRLKQQGGQGEVVGEVGLATTAQIGEVLLFGHVGLRHHHPFRASGLQQMAQHLHDPVGLRQMNAAGVGRFPDEADRVQPQPAHPMAHHLRHQPCETEQHFGTAPVHVHLIRAKGGPHLSHPHRTAQLGEQGRTPRPHHVIPAGVWRRLEHTGATGFLIA